MRLTAAAHTDRGQVRRENQDCYGYDADVGLFVLADGMGGRAAGARASAEAVRIVMEAIAAGTDEGDGGARLEAAIAVANRRIWQLAEADPALHGMGTTVVTLLVEGATGHVAHAGDSRLYRVRGEAIEALTRDHSYAAELAGQGIELADGMSAHYRGMLTRAVGVEEAVEVEVGRVPLAAGDLLLLCSDGVYRPVPPDELRALVTAADGDLAARAAAIVARANEAGGPDNATVVVVRVEDDAP